MTKQGYIKSRIEGPKLIPLIHLCLLVVAITLYGCSSISPSKTKAFQDSIVPVNIGMQTQLDLISVQIAEGQIQGVLNLNKKQPPLLDVNFPPVLSPTTKASLLNQIAVIQEYANLLRQISDRSYRGQFTDAVGKLNAQIGISIDTINGLKASENGNKLASDQTITGIKKQLGLLSGIAASMGEFAIDIYAQGKAIEVAKKYDPVMQDYCKSLQIIIHPFPDITRQADEGLITLTQVAHRDVRNALAQRFEANKPPTGNEVEKMNAFEERQRRFVTLYRENLEGERRSILALGGLRSAIGEIANAHAALAKGEDIDFWVAVNRATDTLELEALALKLKQTEK